MKNLLRISIQILVLISMIPFQEALASNPLSCEVLEKVTLSCQKLLENYNKEVQQKEKTDPNEIRKNRIEDFKIHFEAILAVTEGYQNTVNCDSSKSKMGNCLIEYRKIVQPKLNHSWDRSNTK